jgi:hypothetical protein
MNSETRLLRTFFWRRLDQPGHDICRLFRTADGWRLAGIAVFFEPGRAYDLGYEVTVDKRWHTQSATVSGHSGGNDIELKIHPIDGKLWQIGTSQTPMTTDCLDIDLGFTPATNMVAIRRLALRVGQEAEAPAAWLNYKTMRLTTLPQRYRRIDKARFQYQAPTVGYSGVLQVSTIGAIVSYPGLFKLVK